jgi:hypothetical protein
MDDNYTVGSVMVEVMDGRMVVLMDMKWLW